MFFIESRTQVLTIIKSAQALKDIPLLILSYELFTGYPMAWTLALLKDVLPFIDRVTLLIEANNHRGRLLELAATHGSFPWQIVTTRPFKKAGLYLLTDNVPLAKKIFSIPPVKDMREEEGAKHPYDPGFEEGKGQVS